MKKLCLLLLTLILLVPQLPGCTQSDELVIQLCTSPDSIPSGSSSKLYYTDWSKGYYQNSKAAREVTVTLGDHEISGTYLRSEIRESEYFETHWYSMSDGRIFALNDKGELRKFDFPRPSKDLETKYSESECLEIARSFVGEFVDVDEYTVSWGYNSTFNWYVVHFKKYVGDLLTSDYIGVLVDDRTGLDGFYSVMLGKIPSDIKVDFDFEEIEARLVERFEQMYGDEMGEYDKLTYRDLKYELTCDKKKRAVLICTVTVLVECYDENGNWTDRYGDELTFRIQHS